MQKVLRNILLLNSSYEKLIGMLAALIYDLNKPNLPSKMITYDLNKPQSVIIEEICKAYIENEIIQKII